MPILTDHSLEPLNATRPHADKGYDSDTIRPQIEADGFMPNIRRLKDFRPVGIRCDRLATNFLAVICIAAIVSYSSQVRT